MYELLKKNHPPQSCLDGKPDLKCCCFFNQAANMFISALNLPFLTLESLGTFGIWPPVGAIFVTLGWDQIWTAEFACWSKHIHVLFWPGQHFNLNKSIQHRLYLKVDNQRWILSPSSLTELVIFCQKAWTNLYMCKAGTYILPKKSIIATKRSSIKYLLRGDEFKCMPYFSYV